MFKVQFSATVSNPDTEEKYNGWVDMSRPFELRSESTDVAVHEFYDREEAVKFITYNIGAIDSEERGTFYAADSRMDLESGEDWSYAAHITEV
jgi:hypothetical protein